MSDPVKYFICKTSISLVHITFQWVLNHFQSIIFNSLHYIDGKLITTITSQKPILSNYNLIHFSSSLWVWIKSTLENAAISLKSCHRVQCLCAVWKVGWRLAGSPGNTPQGSQPAWAQIWVQQVTLDRSLNSSVSLFPHMENGVSGRVSPSLGLFWGLNELV